MSNSKLLFRKWLILFYIIYLMHSHKVLQDTIQNFMLLGMASEISKSYTYKCVDCSRHNEIKGAKTKCAH